MFCLGTMFRSLRPAKSDRNQNVAPDSLRGANGKLPRAATEEVWHRRDGACRQRARHDQCLGSWELGGTKCWILLMWNLNLCCFVLCFGKSWDRNIVGQHYEQHWSINVKLKTLWLCHSNMWRGVVVTKLISRINQFQKNHACPSIIDQL